jgi:DNA-binding transcriptional regulator GbsR (MarR family)
VNSHELLYDMTIADDVEQTLLQAVERFALLLTEAGMPRMPSRVFAYLVMEDRNGFTAGELAHALHVSPAAISGAVRYLVQTRMIVRERNPGARRDHYRLHDDIWYESTLERVGLLRRWEQLLSETIELVGPDRAGRSLLETRAFLAFLQEEYPVLMTRWRERKRALFGA